MKKIRSFANTTMERSLAMKNKIQEEDLQNPVKREKKHEEKKYQFMKEYIRPQGKHRVRRMLRRLGLVLGMLILFCGICVLTFSIMRKYLPVESLGTEVIYVTPEPSDEPEVLQRGEAVRSDNREIALEEYSAMSKKLMGRGDEARGALVQLQPIGESSSAAARETYCGVMFQKSSQGIYILIMADALPQMTERALATLADGSQSDVELVGKNAAVGIAVYRVSLSDVSEQMQNEVISLLSEESSLTIGTPVLAVGKPNGVLFSVHTGVITNRLLPVPVTDDELNLCTVNVPYCKEGTGYILDIHGRMIGVMTTAYSDISGTLDAAFLTVGSLQNYVDCIIRRENKAYLGVKGSAVSEEEAKKFQLEQGMYVSEVEAASPAYRGGMRVADVITQIDGKNISTAVELQAVLRQFTPGDELQITILRKDAGGSKKKNLSITLG